jgi:hypothetical protein
MPAAATVDGRLTAGGGGKEDDSTRATGAALGCTEPVTSLGPPREKGLSLKRVVSELQPAAPTAITANATARGHKRNNATTEAMVYSLIRYKLSEQLTPWG